MPFFDYKCNHCGFSFECLILSGQSDGKKKCPVCKKDSSKQIGAPIFKIKGYSEENNYGLKE